MSDSDLTEIFNQLYDDIFDDTLPSREPVFFIPNSQHILNENTNLNEDSLVTDLEQPSVDEDSQCTWNNGDTIYLNNLDLSVNTLLEYNLNGISSFQNLENNNLPEISFLKYVETNKDMEVSNDIIRIENLYPYRNNFIDLSNFVIATTPAIMENNQKDSKYAILMAVQEINFALNPYYNAELDQYLVNYHATRQHQDLDFVLSSLLHMTNEETKAISQTLLSTNKKSLAQNYEEGVHLIHLAECLQVEVACPFWVTECQWFDNIPSVTQHIRDMHADRLVRKHKTSYFVNTALLQRCEMGYKLAQVHCNRIFLIGMTSDESYIYVTVHMTCDGPYNHSQLCWASLSAFVPDTQCSTHWSGPASPLIVPPAQLQHDCLRVKKPCISVNLNVELAVQ